MRGIGLMITDYQFYWPSELKFFLKKRVWAEKASERGGQLVEIFLWGLIGLGDRRAARSDPPPPLLVSVIT